MPSSHTRAAVGNDEVPPVVLEAFAMVMAHARQASSLSAMVMAVIVGLREVGLKLMAHTLEERDQPFRRRQAEVPCPKCTKPMSKRRKLAGGSRYTLLGKLKYKRCRYYCGPCKVALCPLDKSLSLAVGLRGHSEEFASRLVLMCTLMPFGRGCEMFERFCGFVVSTRLACALAMNVGGYLHRDEIERAEQLWKERSEKPETFEPVPAKLRTIQRRKRVYVMMDDSKLGIQEGRRGRRAPKLKTLRKLAQQARRKAARLAKRQKLGPKKAQKVANEEQALLDSDLLDNEESWRNVRALLVFDDKDLAEVSKKRRQILRRRVIAHVGTKEQWLQLVHMALHEEGVYTAHEVVVVADGGSGIWEMVDELLPSSPHRKVVQILDWYHAASHLWRVARALKGCKTKAQRQACAIWVQPLLDYLTEGKVANVIQRLRKLRRLSDSAQDEVRKCIKYFDDHRGRMRYHIYRERGMQIGSGAIESVHAWVIQARCRLPGMRWSIDGANAILRLRCAWASGRWDEEFGRAAHEFTASA